MLPHPGRLLHACLATSSLIVSHRILHSLAADPQSPETLFRLRAIDEKIWIWIVGEVEQQDRKGTLTTECNGEKRE